MYAKVLITLSLVALLLGCQPTPWNNPYPHAEQHANTHYTAFKSRPKTLDPAKSYAANEYTFVAQIYEPPLQYHYLKRPYTLIPLSATEVPHAVYYDASDQPLGEHAALEQIAYSQYTIHLKPGIRYQPHPAFAQNSHDLSEIEQLSDFKHHATRELVAADYVYQIKRLAHPKLNSPILSLMSDYIIGLPEYAKTLKQHYQKGTYLDLTQYDLAGVKALDRYTYQINIKGKYPQFVFWLAMPFFSPMPAEADRFYQQPGMQEKNLTLDWYPIGTGPYYLTVNNPNRQMVLQKNPNFHGETYPTTTDTGQKQALPFIDRAVYTLEKETISYWNKFLQGYYDASVIQSDNFDQAINIDSEGQASLTQTMQNQGIQLKTAVETSIFYMGFNMADPVVGGYTEAKQKLRQAISIAVDYEEYIAIFQNGRGIASQGPLPPGIFGHVPGAAGINPFVYQWENAQPIRKSIDTAKQLLLEAGYPGGIDPSTHAPLILYLDTTGAGPAEKSRLAWFRKQLKKLNIQLQIRATDYNRFQEKMRKGNAQLFQWGWNADYPDPENFLFLLYGPNGKIENQGENAANYDNPEFNRYFQRMKNQDNGPERQHVINQMIHLLREDAPWLWGFHPKAFTLHHEWYKNAQPNLMANNTLKYLQIDPEQRQQQRTAWNQPVTWPLIALLVLLCLLVLPGYLGYRRRERQTAL